MELNLRERHRAMKNWSKILKGGQEPIYVLHGEEKMLSAEAAHWLKANALGGEDNANGMEDFNLDRFDATDQHFNLSKVISVAEMPPMLTSRRVVWIRSVETLNLQSKSKLTDFNTCTCTVVESEILILV